jgi:hypothetical protein
MATRKRIYVDFTAGPPTGGTVVPGTGAIAAVTDNVVNAFVCPGGQLMLVRNELQNDDIAPTYTIDTDCTNGWELPIDSGAASGDGIEVSFGGISSDASLPYAFKVGTDPAFELRTKIGIPDVSEVNLFVGFRKAGAYVTAMDTAAEIEAGYADKCGFSIEAGVIHAIISNDNTDEDVDTTLTWADDAVKTLAVKVSAAGVVTFYVNGTICATVPTTTTTIDTDDILIPYIYCSKIAASGTDTPPILNYLFVGYSE